MLRHTTIFSAAASIGLLCLLGFASGLSGADSGDDASASDRGALAAVRDYVGKWRGVGQLRRGSNEGSWIERQEWVWKFTSADEAETPAAGTLTFESKDAKYIKSGELSVGENEGEVVLAAKSTDDAAIRYVGQVEDGKLTLTAADPPAAAPARISLKLIAGGDRLVVLYERKAPSGDSYVRLAEVGYTREGSGFGKGASYVECIVTGGKGTIAVMHEGKTYYVCCAGCRDLFDQDPAAAVAEYKQRKELEKQERAEKPKDNE